MERRALIGSPLGETPSKVVKSRRVGDINPQGKWKEFIEVDQKDTTVDINGVFIGKGRVES